MSRIFAERALIMLKISTIFLHYLLDKQGLVNSY